MEISNLIDSEVLQLLQTNFCQSNGIYMLCLGCEYEVITKQYGSKEACDWIEGHVSREKYLALIEKSRGSRIEHFVEIPGEEPFVRLCAVAINISGKNQITWIVTAIVEDELDSRDDIPDYMDTVREEQLYRTLTFLSQMSRQIFAAKMGEVIAQDAMRESMESERRMELQLRRSESMTEIVRQLESDHEFQQIAEEVIRVACQCLHIEAGALLRENQDHTVEELCGYSGKQGRMNDTAVQKIDKKLLPFFDGKSYTVSSDTSRTEEFENFFRKYGLTAGIFLPIPSEEKAVLYLCFCDREPSRNWDVMEIKFLNDVKHIVQEVLSKGETKNSLASSHAALEAILENAGCGIYVMDPADGSLLYRNQKFGEIFQKTAEMKKNGQMAAVQKNRSSRYEEVYLPLDERWVDINRTRIQWVDGREVSLCTVYDVTDKKNYQQKIESQANNDFLTGLYNRMRCEQDLDYYIRETVHKGTKGAVLYLDLDDFKHINDGLGHQYGDILLKEVSDSISRIRGVEDCCYRIGGDEFIVIVKDSCFPELNRIVDDILGIFQSPWVLKGDDYYCTMSLGIVCFPADADTVEDVIRKGDLALYAAKRKGKNGVEFYNQTGEDSPYRRLDLENNIRRAAMNACAEFEVYYQPIVNIDGETDRCCGAEALTRWNSAELGFISPGDFIPIAEYLGLINPIGEHVLMQAAKQCRYWNDMGHPDYHINVNLSVVQLIQNDIVDKIRHVLEETRINPKNLRLEVTESLAIDDMRRMVRVLNQIKELGVGVALDDFGTGFSSLNHIRELPIDVIKIDRCFIEHIAEDDFSEAFVKMVVELASVIDVEICVEGVENISQYRKVKDAKVEMIQGFYFDRPMKLEEFEAKYL